MKHNKIRGFTLVEILLALAILGVGLVSILSIFAVGISSARTAIDITRAGLASQMTLETIKQQGYENLSVTTDETLPNLTDWNGDDIGDYTNFTRKLTVVQDPVVQDPISYISDWRSVELIVKYANNNKEIARFVTYITKDEP